MKSGIYLIIALVATVLARQSADHHDPAILTGFFFFASVAYSLLSLWSVWKDRGED